MDAPYCNQTTKRPSPDNFESVILIVVGSGTKETSFQVHAGLLKHYSSYFRNALKESWVEGETKIVRLAADEPANFKTFFHWLYSGKLYYTLTPEGKVPFSDTKICSLYVFGDARGIPEFCNAAVDLLFVRFAHEWAYPATPLRYVYDNTSANSKLRKLLVDLSVGTFAFSDLRSYESRYPKDFLVDVVLRSRELKTWPGNFEDKKRYLDGKRSQLCNYHDHKSPHITRDG
ncbi:hypothetical protein BDU57DRAFT_558026 [Ampelomyces quisqualis]|uniref:BTB domain-containing protein n=1 Tax=Ampelomyces quisqualis TaxID=50730 RepID=A0A6A5QG80_AMPQU|nr:hypothetical protein BDU57DRAFT_558026 [Ampelomyces quisqualis]